MFWHQTSVELVDSVDFVEFIENLGLVCKRKPLPTHRSNKIMTHFTEKTLGPVYGIFLS